MLNNIDLFKDYENARLQTAEEFAEKRKAQTVAFESLPESDVEGIPICVRRDAKGKLQATFIPDTHLLAIGATRSGKTTGYVLPTINVLLNKKHKPSLVISDPKQELFRETADKFAANGYRVLVLDLTNYHVSDCWNPLTGFYRLYQQYLAVDKEITVTKTPNGLRNVFRGVVYESQQALDDAVSDARDSIFDEIEKGLTAFSANVIPSVDKDDPYWEDSARNLLQAFLYAMLEDSAKGRIRENQYSFDTILRIFDTFTDKGKDYDGGYFSDRNLEESKALQLARKCILEQAETTRRCISSVFVSKMNKFRDSAVRRITAGNTFEMKELDDGGPVVIFVSFKDEESLHYEVISLFLSSLYSELIGVARSKGGKLQRPFYFMLDEFGNLPRFTDFDKVISACAGRNIWFLLVLQSYAQLNNIYGEETAGIIKDNLNVHVFFGTNNSQTKHEFSGECGKKTVISPTSALNGSGESIMNYEKDSVALVPVSALTGLCPGECFVTQMHDDCLKSRIERSYTCPEFASDNADLQNRRIDTCNYHRSVFTYVPIEDEEKKNPLEKMFVFGGSKSCERTIAFTMQEKLHAESHITVAWLQSAYSLTYLQARKLADLLIHRGWIPPHAVGVRYPVLQDNLFLRKIDPSEAEELVDDITPDSSNILRSLRKNPANGEQLRTLSEVVCSRLDAMLALEMLKRHKLVFCHNKFYFACVSDFIIDVFIEIANAKRRNLGDLNAKDREKYIKMLRRAVDLQ